MESYGLLPGSNNRPADLLIPHWCSGKDAALEFTTVNPLQAALVRGASQKVESAVDQAHRVKCRKYGERCAREGITFLPLAVETLGGWHTSALDSIRRLGRKVARNVGKEDQKVKRHFR